MYLSRGLGWWCYVCVSLDSLCRWQVQVSVYCARRIHAHLRCTQCSIMLHLWISASYRVFVCGRYRKYRLVCVWLSDLNLSRYRPLLRGTVPAIERVRMTSLPKNGKSGPHRRYRYNLHNSLPKPLWQLFFIINYPIQLKANYV